MLKYHIQFAIYIDENKRPRDAGYLSRYVMNHLLQFESEQDMASMVNNLYQNYTKDPGMTVFKDGGTDVGTPGPSNIRRRMFVPWHMITHMDAEIRLYQDVADTKPQLVEQELLLESKEIIQ